MKSRILNKDFQHPSDGLYQIEAKGNHPNRAAGIIQVIDDTAADSIVNRFNAEAAAGQLRHGNEMLIDHEHFSDQPDQETRAYGWLQELQNRNDGIYGRIRWTATGKTAVDGGDYRFFSTEYERQDLKAVNDGKPKTVRPLRLAGLTLTNMNNNRGQKPITNRSKPVRPAPADGKCPDCGQTLSDVAEDPDTVTCRACKQDFASSSEPAANQQQNTKNKMKNVATKLGLAAEAREDAVLDAVTKIMNRVTELNPLAEENKALKAQITAADAAAVDALLAAHGVKDAKVLNRLKPVLQATPAAERATALADFGFKPIEAAKPATKVLNRGTGTLPGDEPAAGEDAQVIAQKITNRAQELKGAAPGRSFDSCWKQASQEVAAKK